MHSSHSTASEVLIFTLCNTCTTAWSLHRREVENPENRGCLTGFVFPDFSTGTMFQACDVSQAPSDRWSIVTRTSKQLMDTNRRQTIGRNLHREAQLHGFAPLCPSPLSGCHSSIETAGTPMTSREEWLAGQSAAQHRWTKDDVIPRLQPLKDPPQQTLWSSPPGTPAPPFRECPQRKCRSQGSLQ